LELTLRVAIRKLSRSRSFTISFRAVPSHQLGRSPGVGGYGGAGGLTEVANCGIGALEPSCRKADFAAAHKTLTNFNY